MSRLECTKERRAEIQELIQRGSWDEGVKQRIQILSQLDIGFTDSLLLERLHDRLAEDGSSRVVRLAMLGNTTQKHLISALKVAALRRGFCLQIFVGGYDQQQLELLRPDTECYSFMPEFILLALNHSNVLRKMDISSPEHVAELESNFLHGLQQLWSAAQENSGAVLLQETLVDVSPKLFGSLDRALDHSPSSYVSRVNECIFDAAASSNRIVAVDLFTEIQQKGLDFWFDPSKWWQAKIQVQQLAAIEYGELVIRSIAANLGLSKKCLVLDLDNTLWGGVIGDDGLEGIELGEGTARGEAHLAIQHYAKQLSQRGIILAVCSKNELSTAKSVFLEHPDMVLTLDDISAFQASWDDKSLMMQRLASELNIGLDSFVFLDDNPTERERVRQVLPMVWVPEVGSDPSRYLDYLASWNAFEGVTFTQEDVDRTKQYQANKQRQELEFNAGSVESFLEGLDMEMDWGVVDAQTAQRTQQLFGKTNQFNTTGIRYTQAELEEIIKSDRADAYFFRLRDRFGDNGIVSCLTIRYLDENVAELENWVMSCRVFGRGLEDAIFNTVMEKLAARDIEVLNANFVSTAKNVVINELLQGLGFSENNQGGWAVCPKLTAAKEHQIAITTLP